MDEILQELVNSRGVAVRVDSGRGVIRGVKLLGLESRNGRKYLAGALNKAATLYEGAKVNVNHPKGSPLAARDYQDRLGSIRNVRVTTEGLFGDLHYNPKHALAEQLAWDAEHAPENVGFSHNVEARTSRSSGQTVVEAILKVQSVDLVADPATTLGLFESEGSSETSASPSETPSDFEEFLKQLTLEDLRSARPELVEAILAEALATTESVELSALREEVVRLRTSDTFRQRQAVAWRLLQAFKLPGMAAQSANDRALVSDLFIESLLSAPDEPAMRRLIQERAELIAAARGLDHSDSYAGRPLSREQQRIEQLTRTLDTEAFARSIL